MNNILLMTKKMLGVLSCFGGVKFGVYARNYNLWPTGQMWLNISATNLQLGNVPRVWPTGANAPNPPIWYHSICLIVWFQSI
jgi:hypothetical protein